MYIIHRPDNQDQGAELRSTLSAAEQERISLDKPVGKQTRVRDQIATVYVTNQDNRDE